MVAAVVVVLWGLSEAFLGWDGMGWDGHRALKWNACVLTKSERVGKKHMNTLRLEMVRWSEWWVQR